MKILIVKLNPFRREGITNVIMNLFMAMDKQDLHMDVAAAYEPGEEYAAAFAQHGGEIFVLRRSMRNPVSYIRALAKRIKDGGYDAIHVHGNSATMVLEMLAARIAGCKMRIAHSHNTTCKYMQVHKLMNPLFQRLCTHRLACGEDAGKWLFGNRDFTVIRNGIDTRKFAFQHQARVQLRKDLGVEENHILIGHVGLFNEAKNQSFLMDILQKLDERYRLVLVGDGPLREQVAQKAEQLQISHRVIFAGVTDRVGNYLSACDLIVMPSLHEGLPLALIEQQANGLQCIVSDNITREVDKTGNMTVLPLSAGAAFWAQKIRELSLPESRERVSAIAIEAIKEKGYDIFEEAAHLKEYYQKGGDVCISQW